VYLQSGGSPTNSDVAIAQGEIYWDGTVEINPYVIDTVMDTIAVDVAGLDGDAMRGTDSANTTVPDAAGTAATAITAAHTTTDAAIAVMDANVDQIETAVITNAAGTDVAADIIALKAETVLIVEDTGTTIPATIATAQADLDTITGTSGVLIDTDAVDADSLKTDAITEIWSKAMSDLAAGAPSSTASVLTAINYLYEYWRNKVVTDKTNSEIVVYKNDGSTKLIESNISDDGTLFTKGEFGAAD